MATKNVNVAASATLGAATVDTVNFAYKDARNFVIVNRGSAGNISFRFDGTAPTDLGDNCYVCPAGQSIAFSEMPFAVTQVKLISAGTPDYTVGVC